MRTQRIMATAGLVLLLTAPTRAPASPPYRFTATLNGAPVTWANCQPIRALVNLDGASPGAFDDLRAAADAITGASGLPLDLTTTANPQPPLPVVGEVFIEWDQLVLGVAGKTTTWRQHNAITGALVEFNTNLDGLHPVGMVAGGRATVYAHELGHVMGLDHVSTPGALMNPNVSSEGPMTAGDAEGLSLVGAAAHCGG